MSDISPLAVRGTGCVICVFNKYLLSSYSVSIRVLVVRKSQCNSEHLLQAVWMAEIIWSEKIKKQNHPELNKERFMEKVGIRLESWRGKLERQVRRRDRPVV